MVLGGGLSQAGPLCRSLDDGLGPGREWPQRVGQRSPQRGGHPVRAHGSWRSRYCEGWTSTATWSGSAWPRRGWPGAWGWQRRLRLERGKLPSALERSARSCGTKRKVCSTTGTLGRQARPGQGGIDVPAAEARRGHGRTGAEACGGASRQHQGVLGEVPGVQLRAKRARLHPALPSALELGPRGLPSDGALQLVRWPMAALGLLHHPRPAGARVRPPGGAARRWAPEGLLQSQGALRVVQRGDGRGLRSEPLLGRRVGARALPSQRDPGGDRSDGDWGPGRPHGPWPCPPGACCHAWVWLIRCRGSTRRRDRISPGQRRGRGQQEQEWIRSTGRQEQSRHERSDERQGVERVGQSDVRGPVGCRRELEHVVDEPGGHPISLGSHQDEDRGVDVHRQRQRKAARNEPHPQRDQRHDQGQGAAQPYDGARSAARGN